MRGRQGRGGQGEKAAERMGGQQEAGEAKMGEETGGQGLYLSTFKAYKPHLVVRDKVQKRLCDKGSA